MLPRLNRQLESAYASISHIFECQNDSKCLLEVHLPVAVVTLTNGCHWISEGFSKALQALRLCQRGWGHTTEELHVSVRINLEWHGLHIGPSNREAFSIVPQRALGNSCFSIPWAQQFGGDLLLLCLIFSCPGGHSFLHLWEANAMLDNPCQHPAHAAAIKNIFRENHRQSGKQTQWKSSSQWFFFSYWTWTCSFFDWMAYLERFKWIWACLLVSEAQHKYRTVSVSLHSSLHVGASRNRAPQND